MSDELNNNGATTETPDTSAVDTGRDVEELRATIAAMKESISALSAELRAKEPEAPKPADFQAYFAECIGKAFNAKK